MLFKHFIYSIYFTNKQLKLIITQDTMHYILNIILLLMKKIVNKIEMQLY